MATGRGTDGRSVTIATMIASTAITAAAGTFESGDVGRAITGTGIPAGATVSAVASDTAATLSVAATAAGSPVVALAAVIPQTHSYGFRGWSPETGLEAATYKSPSSGTTPDRISNTFTPAASGRRSRG